MVSRAREQATEEQCDYILSLLCGHALEEVRLRMRGQKVEPSDFYSYMRTSFGENAASPNFCTPFITVYSLSRRPP